MHDVGGGFYECNLITTTRNTSVKIGSKKVEKSYDILQGRHGRQGRQGLVLA